MSLKENVAFLQPEGIPASMEELSADFLERAVERLGVAAGVIAGVVLAGFVLRLVAVELLGGAPPPWLAAGTAGSLLLLTLSVAMVAICRRSPHPARALRFGLAYQLLGALCIALPQYAGPHLVNAASGYTVSWIGVWILLFPLLVPSPLKVQVAISLASASLPPLVFLGWSATAGAPLPSPGVMLSSFTGPFVCAGLAVVPAWLILRLGRRVSSAQKQVKQLGAYRLVQLLGKGGMGEVWRAEHRMLTRPAAVKLVSSSLTTDSEERSDALLRFEREAQMISQLHSPHTVALFDFGVTEDGTLYYVMELLDGVDLHSLVSELGPLSPSRVVHVLAQACESLAEAHEAGIVHRDIKPANLMLCKLGIRRDVVKVLDFGLARRTKAADPRLTAKGLVVGTAGYMAPEQATNKPVDGRTDLYALGCVGYWLLTGHEVFDSGSSAGLLLAHVNTPPTPPSEHIAVPADLEELVLACLAKAPDERPPDALTLRRRLLTLDVPTWTLDDAEAWWRANAARLDPHRIADPGDATESIPGA